MPVSPKVISVSAFAAAVLALIFWSGYEVRQQKLAVEESLLAQAQILAGSIGPGLTAASNAAREIDEIIVWKLLDNARLLAQHPMPGPADSDRLQQIAESNGLDRVAYLDPRGNEILVLGTAAREASAPATADLLEVLSGSSNELILDPLIDRGVEHIAVAVGRREGGAVLVQVESSSAQTYVKSLGVENLLQRLVANAAVLYLGYTENPGGVHARASWDGGPLPQEQRSDDEPLRWFRDREVYEVSVPLEAPAGRRAMLRVGLDGAPLRQAAVSATRRSLLVGTALAAFGLAATAVAQVTRLRSRDREHATRRVAVAEAARRRSERLAAAGALAAGLAHEVRSPLNAIGIASQRLERKLEDDGPRRLASSIRSEVDRLESVLREFLDLARPPNDARRTTDINALCAEVVDLLEPEAQTLDVELTLQPGPATAAVHGDAIRRAVINLVRNAVQASPRGSRVEIRTHSTRNGVEILVEDRGAGIDPEIRNQVFDAFVTGRASGTGLGLALVRRAADEHKGTIKLENRGGGGTRACLQLPGGD